jgi:opacity protein-like surface antigen
MSTRIAIARLLVPALALLLLGPAVAPRARAQGQADGAEAASEARTAGDERTAGDDRTAGDERTAAEEAREAAEEARAAAAAARAAADHARQQRERAFSRKGPYLGVGAFYAPEAFDEAGPVIVRSSRGLIGLAGYRLHPRLGVELRYDWLEGFDFDSPSFSDGEIEAWSLVLGAKGYLLTGRYQPYLTGGLGVIDADVEADRVSDGRRVHDDETEALVRIGVGVDVYLSEVLVWNLEGTINIPSGGLSDLDYGLLGTGLQLRF